MNCLVTGANGFIGVHLVQKLKNDGHTVTCLVRKTSNTKALESLGVSIVRSSLDDISSLKRLVAEKDWIFHIAGAIKSSNAN